MSELLEALNQPARSVILHAVGETEEGGPGSNESGSLRAADVCCKINKRGFHVASHM